MFGPIHPNILFVWVMEEAFLKGFGFWQSGRIAVALDVVGHGVCTAFCVIYGMGLQHQGKGVGCGSLCYSLTIWVC